MDFWSVTAHTMDSSAWNREMSLVGLAPSINWIVINKDGSVDGYDGPKRKEANGVPAKAGRHSSLFFRFVRPELKALDRSSELNIIEPVN